MHMLRYHEISSQGSQLPVLKRVVSLVRISTKTVTQKRCVITEAECECPAGTAPTASCKQITALCYTLDSFCKRRQLPQLETCTERLQTWNHPRPRRVKPVPDVLNH